MTTSQLSTQETETQMRQLATTHLRKKRRFEERIARDEAAGRTLGG